MEIVVAKYAGACFGVNRALDTVRRAMAESKNVYTLGPLIHNPRVVADLEDKGVQLAESLEDIPAGSTVVIRSHGVPPSVIQEARERNLIVSDATCPHVSKAQSSAAELRQNGYRVVVVGEKGHPEVVGICAYAGEDVIVATRGEDLPDELPDKIGVVVQTTQSASALDSVMAVLNEKVSDVRLCNTICFATRQRQRFAEELADTVDTMIIIGGRNSGNTRRLIYICSEKCPHCIHIEDPCELRKEDFASSERVGITAGASTPASQIDDVIKVLEAMK